MAALVELPILGLLTEGPHHGYELKLRLESMVGFFGTVSYGSMYPMLRSLERRRQVIHALEIQRGLNRIVYRMTGEGETRFVQLMHNPRVPLTQKLLFFQAIPPGDRREILERHEEEWVQTLAHYRKEQEQINVRQVDRYRTALLAREVKRLEQDIAWLQDLIDEEATNSTPIQNGKSSELTSKKTKKRRKSNPSTRSC